VAILAVNYGSSSLKTALYAPPSHEGETPQNLAKARIARLSDGHLVTEWDGCRDERQVQGDPLAAVADALTDAGLPGPQAIGHRFVHGGDYGGPQLLTPDVITTLEKLIPWAPQHEPAALGGVAEAAKRWPDAPQVGCFDSAFHRTMPEVAQRLPLPAALWDEGIRRYGFHGLNYDHVVHPVGAADLGRAVIAHLGNGSSIAAIEDGRSIDTTMGFTPDAGLFMGSRSGDIDPGVLLYLAGRDENPVSVDALREIFQEQSGLRGLSGGESDMAALLARTDAAARLAVEAFIRQAAKQTAAYATVLGGIDTLVFTGGIGEHAAVIREGVVSRLGMLTIGQVLVVAADEEAVIARQTAAVTSAVRGAATP
jgi:acetate kinase